MKKVNLLFGVFLFFIFSCTKNETNLKVRVSAISVESGNIEFKVFPENEFGEIINGAAVLVTDSSQCVYVLEFNSKTCCYEGEIIPYGNEYTVEVNSNAYNEIKKLKISHTVLHEKPTLNFFKDSDGSSVLNGQTINPSKEIQLCWNNLGEDVVYTIQINSSTQIVYQQSTYENTIIIEPNILPESDKLFVTISAQKTYGDITFREFNYYSSSIINNSSILFNTKL